MRSTFRLAATLLCFTPLIAAAQGVPTTQPNMITLIREQVKPGRNAEHEKWEAGWPAAYEKAKSPFIYIGMSTLTGANEAWYVSTYASNAAIGQSMKDEATNPVLAAELEHLSKGDAEYITGMSRVMASARPDLSYGAFPNIAKQRFWAITTFRVRPGHEAQFDAAAKAYAASAKRNSPSTSFRMYQVIAGIPGPTYLAFGSVESYADFDGTTAGGNSIMMGMTPDEGSTMQKLVSEGLINSETQRLQLSAQMSYVTKETKDQDPAFWRPKKPAAKPAP